MKSFELAVFGAFFALIYFSGCSASATRAENSSSNATPKANPSVTSLAPLPQLPWEQIDRRNPALSETILEKNLLASSSGTLAGQSSGTLASSPSGTLAGQSGLKLLTRYVEADFWSSSNHEKSCHAWKEVLETAKTDSSFLLLPVAKLHAAATCPELDELTGAKAGAVTDADLATQPWLHELQSRVSLQISIRNHDLNREMRASSEVAGFEKTQKERIRLIQRALEIASQLKETSLQADYQAQLERTAPRFILQPSPDQRLAVAADFKQARQFDKARAFYTQIVKSKSSDFEKMRAMEGMRMTFKLQKNTPRYLKASAALARFAHDAFFFKKSSGARGSLRTLPKFLDAQITFARAVWTEHDPKLAEKILLKAEAAIGGRVSVAESAWVRARIREETGNINDALTIYRKIDLSRVESTDLKNKILWNNAWDLRRAGRNQEAITKLSELTKDPLVPNATRAKFWLGRTYLDLKKIKEANATFESLINDDPMGIYGLLAYRELKRPIPPAEVSNVENAQPSLTGESRQQLEWLVAAHETDLAQNYLDQIPASTRSNFNEGQTLDLLQLYASAGSYQSLFAHLNELAPEKRNLILQSHPELLFPQPWRKIATESAEKAQIPTELIYSIMRQESSFNPNARSFADAFGLMQLIPEMAKRAGQSLHMNIESHEDLYDPQINIPLGAIFLHQLLQHWHGQFILAVASYNANEGAIAGWIRTRYKGDPLEFIEDVPYEETRAYMKLVLRNFIFYSRLNSGGKPLPFPEHCLENIQAAKL